MTRRWLLVSLCVWVGCGGDASPADSDALPASLTASGSYAVTTTIDLTAAAVLPEPISGYLEILRGLRQDPGGTFFALLDDAGVPLVDELRAALPDALEDRLAGWIGDAVSARFGTEIDAILAASETALARFDLLSRLELPPPDDAGRSAATHGLRALRFQLAGGPVEVAIPESAAPPLVTVAAVEARLSRGAGGADGRLELGDHAFGLAYGEAAYAVVEAVARARLGAGLRQALGTLVDCGAVATAVAGKCLLGVCVGHQPQLEALCERGLDEVVVRLHAKLASLRFDAVRLASGRADLWDAVSPGGAEDGVVDRLAAGAWQASLDLGMGPRAVPASFTAQRR